MRLSPAKGQTWPVLCAAWGSIRGLISHRGHRYGVPRSASVLRWHLGGKSQGCDWGGVLDGLSVTAELLRAFPPMPCWQPSEGRKGRGGMVGGSPQSAPGHWAEPARHHWPGRARPQQQAPVHCTPGSTLPTGRTKQCQSLPRVHWGVCRCPSATRK